MKISKFLVFRVLLFALALVFIVRALAAEAQEKEDAAAKRAWLFREFPQLILVLEPPVRGSFFSLKKSAQPPLPFQPFPELNLYSWAEGMYFFDDLELSYDAPLLKGPMMMLSEAPPSPGGEGGGGGGTNEVGNFSIIHSTNDLWLEITGLTNTTGYFLIHTPETNGIYDLFSTTNLSPLVAGLNLTNWLWLVRTTSGQTNLTVTSLTSVEGYFQLGTMLDSDADGLTDAYEKLVSHTDPYNPDTDGDGISDFDELWLGTSPLVGGSPPSLASITIPKCPVP